MHLYYTSFHSSPKDSFNDIIAVCLPPLKAYLGSDADETLSSQWANGNSGNLQVPGKSHSDRVHCFLV